MAELEKLGVKRPDGIYATEGGLFGVRMRYTSGQNDDSQWFVFKPTIFADPYRIEWENGTMLVAIEPVIAEALMKSGYAHNLSAAEVEEYNKSIEPEPEPKPEPKVKKKESDS